MRSVATGQESDWQEKKPVSCPAMESLRIRDASVINDVEWLGRASEAHSQSYRQQDRHESELDDCEDGCHAA